MLYNVLRDEEETKINMDLVLQTVSENIIDRLREQRGSCQENGN